jgi:DNA ligase-associated metallophosphoesterase
MEIVLFDNHFLLLPERAIYWRERSALILSDTHFGKTAHFRKSGIAIPDSSFNTDIHVLDSLVKKNKPGSLIIVGDMFHSSYNNEVEKFLSWRNTYSHLQIFLARGNHDIMHPDIYTHLGVIVDRRYIMDDFVFSHELCHDIPGFCFSGHIHPGIRVSGNARQELRFPCFHFSDTSCTLPAFSRFTGLSLIEPGFDDRVYMIVGKDVIQY